MLYGIINNISLCIWMYVMYTFNSVMYSYYHVYILLFVCYIMYIMNIYEVEFLFLGFFKVLYLK